MIMILENRYTVNNDKKNTLTFSNNMFWSCKEKK